MIKFLFLLFFLSGICYGSPCETDQVKFYLVKNEIRTYDNYTLSYFFENKNMEKYQKNKKHELELYKIIEKVIGENKEKDVLVVYTNLYCIQKSVFISSKNGKRVVVSEVYKGKNL